MFRLVHYQGLSRLRSTQAFMTLVVAQRFTCPRGRIGLSRCTFTAEIASSNLVGGTRIVMLIFEIDEVDATLCIEVAAKWVCRYSD